MTRQQRKDKTTIEHLAKMFGLPGWDQVDDINQEYYADASRGAPTVRAQKAAEIKAQEEVYAKWYDAVEGAASKIFKQQGLELEPVGRDRRPSTLKIVPTISWADAADKIRESINGIGLFHFVNLREFLDSGPYTLREAVLMHTNWFHDFSAVYGGPGARELYERAWR